MESSLRLDVFTVLLCSAVSCLAIANCDLISVWYFFMNEVCFLVVDKHGMMLLVVVCLRL